MSKHNEQIEKNYESYVSMFVGNLVMIVLSVVALYLVRNNNFLAKIVAVFIGVQIYHGITYFKGMMNTRGN